jgi:sialic acid synthase SpsE
LLSSYTNAEISLSDHVPGSDESVAAVAVGADLQRQLWTLAGQADPNGNASRL